MNQNEKYCEELLCSRTVYDNKELCVTCSYGKLNVVLDLDNTLIFTCDELYPPFDFKIKEGYIYLRPFVKELLAWVFKNTNVFIWSAGDATYVKKILKHLLQKDQIPVAVLTRKDCSIEQTSSVSYLFQEYYSSLRYFKPLQKLKFNLKRTVLIDDHENAKKYNPYNTIQVSKFEIPTTSSDNCLVSILETLKYLESQKNVQNVLQ